MQDFIASNLGADSIGGLVIRAVIWIIAVLIFAIGIDNGRKHTNIKSDVGIFLAFFFRLAILIYLIFGTFPTF